MLLITPHSLLLTTFSYNTADDVGGAIRAGDELMFDITNSSNNSATAGGVMSIKGAKSFIISNSTFTSNKAISCDGGVIEVTADQILSVFIFNCTFSYNSARWSGGVIKLM